ncbi:hypothetical protein Trydic_g904 [Trypoxylus dichotomus]
MQQKQPFSNRQSAYKNFTTLGTSNSDLRRMIHDDLKLHSYKMLLHQELSERGLVNNRTVSAEMFEQVLADPIVPSSDEAHFHLRGGVNKHNWLGRKPRGIQERPLQFPRLTV